MKRSQKYALLAALCLLSGLLLWAAWLVLSFAIGGELLMNGPWLLILLVLGLGAAWAVASIIAEWREQLDERERGQS